MQKIVGNPPFCRIFKDNESAKKALTILVTAKGSGYTNKQIMDIPFFKNLFIDEYVANTQPAQFEWRLKNMARDLKKMSFENLNVEWHEFKTYFENTRRKVVEGK